MTGLEKMKSQILDEAKALADSKIAEANRRAEEILEEAKADAEKSVASISQRSDKDVANYRERIISSIDLQKRTKLLAAKQEVIAQVLDQSYDRLKTMETGEYFAMLLKLAEKYVLPQEGIMYFSQADLGKMPESFKSDVKKLAETKGGKLNISGEGRNIENGFVLAYGGIEENCTLKAIFDAKRDEFADKIHHILF
jgi:V/A-type H+-transporting ATPase subunit E